VSTDWGKLLTTWWSRSPGESQFLRVGEMGAMFNYSTIDESKVEYLDIAPVTDLPPGERLFVEIEAKPIVIFNIAGQFFSIADVCSHDDGPVGEGDVDGYNITCPRHGAQFDIRTGKVVQMPAVVDIPAYPVRVVDGMLQLGIPK
jgi:3-phenylpropionate/trans-cinnamate dioxygenase ferredoxin component